MQKLRFINGNGTEIDLTAGRYGITEWEGFSNADLNIQTQQVPFQDGSVFLDALYNPRELSVTLAINDENNLEKRYELKRELISIMNAKLGEGYLYYKNDFIEKRIKVVPQLPIFENKNSNDPGTLKASLSWTAPEVYWEDVEETKVNLNENQVYSVENTGDVKSQVVINSYVTKSDNTRINNISNNEKIEVLSNVKMKINTKQGQKNIVEQNVDFPLVNLDFSCFTQKENTIVVGKNNELYISSDYINFSKIYETEYNILDIYFNPDDLKYYFVTNLFNSSQYKLYIYIYTTSDFVNVERTETIISDYIVNTEEAYFVKTNSVFGLIFKDGYYGNYRLSRFEDGTYIGPRYSDSYNAVIQNGESFFLLKNNIDVLNVYETINFSDVTLKSSIGVSSSYIFKTFYKTPDDFNKIYIVVAGTTIEYSTENYSVTQSWPIAVGEIYFIKNTVFALSNNVKYLSNNSWETVPLPSYVWYSTYKATVFQDRLFFYSSLGIVRIDMLFTYKIFDSSVNNLLNINNTCLRNGSAISFDGDTWITGESNYFTKYNFIIDYQTYQLGMTSTGEIYKLTSDINMRIGECNANVVDFFINKLNSSEICVVTADRRIGISKDANNWQYYTITDIVNDNIVGISYNNKDKYYILISQGVNTNGKVFKSYDLKNWKKIRDILSRSDNYSGVLYNSTINDFYIFFYNVSLSQQQYIILFKDITSFLPAISRASSVASNSDANMIVVGQNNEISYLEKNTTTFMDKSFSNLGSIYVAWVDFLNAFVLSGSINNTPRLYISYDAKNWTLLKNINMVAKKIANNLLTVFSQDYNIVLHNDESLISKLTQDSNMSFGVNVGQNLILSNFNGTLIYRQKYLGV